jgi:iron complex outermembrane receptor protein
MTINKLFVFSFLFVCQYLSAQHDTIALNEVKISDAQLKQFSNTQSVQKLNDSVIVKNQSSLLSLLNYNSVIYFKENGLGMVSSPSFRGTTAQQTAVIWNGININSQLLGQTDFNTITTRDFNSIVVRAGGGSAIYGSSAIGGSIHLNNDFDFNKTFTNEVQLSYGSFSTLGAHYRLVVANDKWSTQLSITRNSSENDYAYLDTDKINENGQFKNSSYNLNIGYRFNSAHTLKVYSQLYDGERHFSGTLTATSRSKYLDFNTRNLLEWDAIHHAYTSKLKLALLTEQYQYYEDKDQSFFTHGKAETVIIKHDLAYKINTKILLNTIFDFTQTTGEGSDLFAKKRQIGSGVLLMKHQVAEKLDYELSLRKEITNNYDSPLLYSFGTKYTFSDHYAVKVNASRNFRIPSFNDLYWQQGGNPNLQPENAYQYELGQYLTLKNIRFSATTFYNKIDNLISWRPNAAGLWQPENTKKVTTYGVETALSFDKKIGKNHLFFNANYAYTVSENQETKQQLIYVPYHKFNASLSYSFDKVTVFSQYLFNGAVYTSSDNFYELKEYQVVNMGANYHLGCNEKINIGFQVLNLLNEKYQSVATRPLPGRNYAVNLIFKL